MKKLYTNEDFPVSFEDIVDRVLGLTYYLNENIVDGMAIYLMNYYKLGECKINYSADLKKYGGTYSPSTGQIEIKISLLENPIFAFKTLTHEFAHKYDEENNIIRNKIRNKNALFATTSYLPTTEINLLSAKLFQLPLMLYKEYYYYSNPAEIFARQESMKMMKTLLTECKRKYKSIENKNQKREAKKKIKEIKRVTNQQKDHELDYRTYQFLSPLTKPFSKFVYNQMGKKLYKQAKKNKVERNFYDDLWNWTYTFASEDLHNEKSKERLLEISELIKDQKFFYARQKARLQVLGFVDNSPESIETNISDMLEYYRPGEKENFISYGLPVIYFGYNHNEILKTGDDILQKYYDDRMEKNLGIQTKNKHTPLQEPHARDESELSLN